VHSHGYGPDEKIATRDSQGHEMYIVSEGCLDVWITPANADGGLRDPILLASVNAGQVAGELALLDGAPRSADLRAGTHGVTLLTLTEEGLATLANEDPRMGMRLMQNLAISLGRRLRTQNRRATQSEPEPISIE
jgi:CRP-like cAMP-binding protein